MCFFLGKKSGQQCNYYNKFVNLHIHKQSKACFVVFRFSGSKEKSTTEIKEYFKINQQPNNIFINYFTANLPFPLKLSNPKLFLKNFKMLN